jgi:hypothetical protein
MSSGLLLPNYALKRSVKAWRGCAADAGRSVAPAALAQALPRPAQRAR